MSAAINPLGPGGISSAGKGLDASGGFRPIQESSSLDQFRREMGQGAVQQDPALDLQGVQSPFAPQTAAVNEPSLLDDAWGSVEKASKHYNETLAKMAQPKPEGMSDVQFNMQTMWDMNEMSTRVQLVTNIAQKISSATEKLLSGQ